jgi:hypothetical protein
MKRVFVTLAILGFLGSGLALGAPPSPTPTPTVSPNSTPSPLVISLTGAITVIKHPKPGPGPLALVPMARSFGSHTVPDHAIYIGFDPDAFFVANHRTQDFLCIQDQGVCVARTSRIGEVTFTVRGSETYRPPAEHLDEAAKLSDFIGDEPDSEVITMNGQTPGNMAARFWLPPGTLTSVCDPLVHWWTMTPVGGAAKTIAMTHTIDLNTEHALPVGGFVDLEIDRQAVLTFERTGKGEAKLKVASIEPSSAQAPPRYDHHFLLHYLAFVSVPANGKIDCKEPNAGAGKGMCPYPTRQQVGCKNPKSLPRSGSVASVSSGRGSNCPPAVW